MLFLGLVLIFMALAFGAFELSVRNASLPYLVVALLCAAIGLFFLIGAFIQ